MIMSDTFNKLIKERELKPLSPVEFGLFHQFVNYAETEFSHIRDAFRRCEQVMMDTIAYVENLTFRVEFLYELLQKQNPNVENEFKIFLDNSIKQIQEHNQNKKDEWLNHEEPESPQQMKLDFGERKDTNE